MELLKKLWVEEEGQDLTETALIIALVSVTAVVALNALSGGINNVFTNISGTLNGV